MSKNDMICAKYFASVINLEEAVGREGKGRRESKGNVCKFWNVSAKYELNPMFDHKIIYKRYSQWIPKMKMRKLDFWLVTENC